MDYEADIECDGDYFFGASWIGRVSGNMFSQRELFEVYIASSYSGLDFLDPSHHLVTIKAGGSYYNVYLTENDLSKHFLFGRSRALWVMPVNGEKAGKNISSSINLKGVIAALWNEGIYFSKPSGFQFSIQGFGSSGKVTVRNAELVTKLHSVAGTEECREGYERDGRRYFMYEPQGEEGSMTVSIDGSAECSWKGVDEEEEYPGCFFKMGIKYDEPRDFHDYSYIGATYSLGYDDLTKDEYAAGVYCAVDEYDTEFYIIDYFNRLDKMLEGAEFQSRMKVYSDSECDVYKKEVPGLGRNGKTLTIYYFVQTELYEAEGGNFLAMGEPNIVLYLYALEKLGLENGEICEVDTFLQVYEDKGGSAFLDFDFSLIHKTEPEYDELTKEDVALFQKYLLGEDVALGNKNYDVNGDGVWDSYDLIKMRRMFTGESPWNADIDNSDADVVSHETSSDHSWLWGQDYYDEGSIEAAVNNEKKTFVGKWENTGSAYFYNNDLLTYGYPMKADDEYPMTLRYEYTADGEGDFIVGSIVKTFEKRKVSFFCDYIYIAESYSGLEDITSGECLGTLTSQTGTKYDVYARRADMGLEVFVLRRDKLPLGKLNKGTIRNDYLLEQLPELVPELKHEVINTYFGVKCVGESSGYISCRPARGRDGYYWGYYE